MTPLGGAARAIYDQFCFPIRVAVENGIAHPLVAPMRSLCLPNPDDKLHYGAPRNTTPRTDSLGLHECAIGAR